VEGAREAVPGGGHGLGADGDADVDGAQADLVRDVLDGLEARRAEAVYGRGARRVGDAGREGGGADEVGGFAVADLHADVELLAISCLLGLKEGGKRQLTFPRHTSSISAGSSFDRAITSFSSA